MTSDQNFTLTFVKYLKSRHKTLIKKIISNIPTISLWIEELGYLNKNDFSKLLKYFKVPYNSYFYNSIYKLFDYNLDGSIALPEFLLIID